MAPSRRVALSKLRGDTAVIGSYRQHSLHWAKRREDVEVTLSSRTPGEYAYVLKMSNPGS